MADSGDVGEEEVDVKLTMEQIKKLIGEDDPELGLEVMDPNRKVLAMLEATRRIRTRPQESLKDVPIHTIDVGADEDEYDALLTHIQDWMRTVQSLQLYGKPVSPPLVDLKDQKYYIIRLKKEGDPRHVDHLFQASDMYYIGFMPSVEKYFFRFKDIELPSWIPSLALPENSSHGAIVDTMFGPHWWDEIFNTCLKCSKENHLKNSKSRLKVLQWTILLLAEPPRILSLKGKVKEVIRTGVQDKVGSSEEGIHSWMTMSKVGFLYKIKPTYLKSMKLLHKFTEYNLFNIEKNKFQPWKIIGSQGEILVFKCDETLVTEIIKKQQDEALKTICSILEEEPSPSGNWKRRIHQSQHPNIWIYLAYLLTQGEGSSFEIRRDAGLLLKRSLRKEFCAMVPAYQDYIKSQLIPCIWKDNALIQSIAGDVITEVLEIIHAEKWDELITSLQTCIEQIKGAMNLIFKMLKSPHLDIRRLALQCIDNYIVRPSLLGMPVDKYLDALFWLYKRNVGATDENGWEEMSATVKSMGSIAQRCINMEVSYLPKILRHPNGCARFEEIICSLHEKKAHSDCSVQSGVSLALDTLEKEDATVVKVINELNSDMDTYSFLRCLTSVSKAVQQGLCQFILPVFRGCTLLLAKEHDKNKLFTCLEISSSVLKHGLSAGNEIPSAQGMSAGIQNLVITCLPPPEGPNLSFHTLDEQLDLLGDDMVGVEHLEEDSDGKARLKVRRSAGLMSAFPVDGGMVYMVYKCCLAIVPFHFCLYVVILL
ncbi:hypothetical protein ACQ4PT_027331 [Festuca glaucescens]